MSDLCARAEALVLDGSSPDDVLRRLPGRGEENDAALWLYSWAVAQQAEERPAPRLALPPVTSE
jgi:hypothetical protein